MYLQIAYRKSLLKSHISQAKTMLTSVQSNVNYKMNNNWIKINIAELNIYCSIQVDLCFDQFNTVYKATINKQGLRILL